MTQRLIQIIFPIVPPDDIARMTKDIQTVKAAIVWGGLMLALILILYLRIY